MEEVMNEKITLAEAQVLVDFATELTDHGVSEIRCPRCNGQLEIETTGNSYKVFCPVDKEVAVVSRGI